MLSPGQTLIIRCKTEFDRSTISRAKWYASGFGAVPITAKVGLQQWIITDINGKPRITNTSEIIESKNTARLTLVWRPSSIR